MSNLTYNKLNLDSITSRIKEILSKPLDEQEVLTNLWQIRAEIEYITSILSLELEGNTEFERITKPHRLKKQDRENIVNQLNEVLLELSQIKNEGLPLFEKLWRLRELVTLLLKVSDKVYRNKKIGENLNN